MTDREYQGDPLDMSWQDIQDRPFKGKGKTVSVIDGNDGSDISVPTLDTPLTHNEVEILEAANDMSPTTAQDIAEKVDASVRTVQRYLKELVKSRVIMVDGRDKWGANVYHWDAPPVPVIRRHATDESDFIPGTIDPLRLTDVECRVIQRYIQFPNNSHTQIARDCDTTQPTVSRILKKYGLAEPDKSLDGVKWTKNQQDIIEELDKGNSVYEVSRRLGCSSTTVYNTIDKMEADDE